MFFQAIFFSTLYSITFCHYIYNVVHKPYKRPNENIQWCYGVCKNDKDDVVLTIKLGSMEWMCMYKQTVAALLSTCILTLCKSIVLYLYTSETRRVVDCVRVINLWTILIGLKWKIFLNVDDFLIETCQERNLLWK